jgi:hypothetical protein
VLDTFATERPLWVATLEATVQAERIPEVRAFLVNALQQGRLGLAALFQEIDPADDEHKAWAVGSFYQALLTGVMVQWLIDQQHAPSGHDLAEALRMISGKIQSRAPEER